MMTALTKIKKQDTAKAQQYFQAKNEFTTGPMELSHMLDEGEESINVVDVRGKEDYDKSHIPGSMNLPRDQWDSEKGLAKDKTNILVCYSQQCHLASKAAEQFSSKGYPVMEMEGGFKTWKESKLETEKT